MTKITIKLEHGIVQNIDGIPPEISIEVRNYDVEKLGEQTVSKDEHGRRCQILEWHSPE